MRGDVGRIEPSAEHNRASGLVVESAIAVHRRLGPGLLESIYERCLGIELAERELKVERQVVLPITYKGQRIEAALRIDLLVADCLIVEIKAVDQLLPIHDAQLLTYLRLSGRQLGLLINFNVPQLKQGLRRLVNSA